MRSFIVCLETGLGRGAKFVSIPVYSEIFAKFLGAQPFYGTLNLQLDEEGVEAVDELFLSGKKFDGIVFDGKQMGGIILTSLRLQYMKNEQVLDVIGVRPLLTSHTGKILEVIAKENIRELWSLKDGCELRIIINGID